MADAQTTELLIAAAEFVAFVAATEMSDECFVSTGIALSRATQLRRQADAIEREDARIGRARALEIKIGEALEKSPNPEGWR